MSVVTVPVLAEPAKPQAPAVLNAQRFTLQNGMTLLVLEDHKTPFVEMDLTFEVGSGDDPAYAPGTSAMIVELLKHASTRHVRADDRYGLIESFGAHPWDTEVGAGEDKTWIRGLVPSHALELALFLESDRMGYFSDGIDARAVNRARSVLKDKAGESWTKSFRSVTYLAIGEMFGPEHAYGSRWSAGVVDRFTASELRVRARRLYAPNRAVLTLTGDVDFARGKKLAQRYFGTLARGAPASERPHRARSGRVTFELTSKTNEPGVAYAWRTPAYLTDADYALDGAARVLRRRLIDRLITPGIARSISARQESNALASAFVLTALPDEGHETSELVSILDSELASLRQNPIPTNELASAKDWLCLGIVDSNAELGGRSGLATSFWGRIRDPNGYATYLAHYRALSAESIERVVREHLGGPPDMVAIRRRGNEEKDMPVPTLPAVPKGKGDAAGVPRDEELRLTPPEVESPAPFQPPNVEDIALSTGAHALLHENHDFPRIRMRLILELGSKPTLASVWLISRLLIDTQLASGKTLRQALLDHGSELTAAADLQTVNLTVSVLPEHFETVSALLVEAATRGKLRAADLESLQKSYRPVQEASISSRLGIWADEFLFTPKSGLKLPYSQVDPNFKNAKLVDLVRVLSKLSAAQFTFAIDGDATPTETRRVLEAATRGLGKQKPERLVPVQLNTGVFLVDDPKSETVGLRVSAQMPTWTDGDGAPGTALRWFFGTNESVTLNMADRFREAGVTAYRAEHINVHHQPRFSIFVFDIEAPPAEIPKILAAITRQMQLLREGHIPAAAVAQTRREWQTSLREMLSGSTGVLGWMTTIAMHDAESNLMTAAYRRSHLFGQEELVRVANARLVSGKLSIIALGNVTPIRPELEKLGLPVTYRKVSNP